MALIDSSKASLPELSGLYSACTVILAVAAAAERLLDLRTASSAISLANFDLGVSSTSAFFLVFFVGVFSTIVVRA